MESYNVGNLAVTQGRYANVPGTAPPSPDAGKGKTLPPGQKSPPPIAAEESFAARIPLPVEQPDKAVNLTDDQKARDQQKARYEEIAGDEEKMSAITEMLNQFMAQFNASLRFSLHKDTSIFSVKFMDMKNNKVLKELPPEEYLDMLANIKKYIGAMIDKKA